MAQYTQGWVARNIATLATASLMDFFAGLMPLCSMVARMRAATASSLVVTIAPTGS